MKQMKLMMVALTLLMGVMLTSCLKGDDNKIDVPGVNVTVVDNLMTVYLRGDNGVVYYPTNPSVIRYTDGTYPERISVWLKYADGVNADSPKKDVSIVAAGLIYSRNLCMQPDTIKNNIPLAGLDNLGIVDVSKIEYTTVNAYCNIVFSYYAGGTNKALVFDLVPVSASGNELTVKLQETIGYEGTSYSSNAVLASFKIPSSVSEINSAIARYASHAGVAPTTLQANEGKIRLKVIATGRAGELSLGVKDIKIEAN